MTPESSFLAFRTTRDPARLGEVFDRCADDLFLVALHLCRDRAEAEDALQATFLVAIERCMRWDAARPLQPWLLGILHKEVRYLRRRARRQPDPARVATPREPAPDLSAMGAELRAAVQAAMAALPEPYRGVVELRLVHALPHEAIAARLSRSPGAVRTQLWRGLELLRRALPAGLGLALGSQLLGEPVLAAVRGRVLAAAKGAGTATAVGGVAFVGAMLMKKIAIGAALVAVCAWAALQWNGGPTAVGGDAAPAPGAVAAATAASSAASGTASDRGAVDAGRREVATLPPVDPAAAGSGAESAGPWTLLVRVVDRRGDPVEGATIALYDEDRRGLAADRPAEHRLDGTPFAQDSSDPFGQCRIQVDRPCFVNATKAGVGTSGDVQFRTGAAELRLRLDAAVRIRGTVLQSDGQPAVGATVEIWRNSWSNLLPPAVAPAPTVAGGRGTFAFDVVPGLDYCLRARGDGIWTEIVEVQAEAGVAEHVVTLCFPGAFSLSGVLLDVDGSPLADGSVALLSGPPNKVGPDGSFRLLREEGGVLEVFGGSPGRTLARATVELTAARPHQHLTLRTTAFVPLAGRVVDASGEPIAGVKVFASDAEPYGPAVATRWRLYESGMPRAVTAADGTFRWQVPADLRFRIRYRPVSGDDTVTCDGPVVAPPLEDLVVVVRDADRQRAATGFELRGRIVADATGAPVASARVECIRQHPSGSTSSGKVDARFEADGHFAIGPVPVKDVSTVAFVFESGEFAPLRIGPFPAREVVQEAVVRMPTFATLDVLVLRADGTPAVDAIAVATEDGPQAYADHHQEKTGADGRVHFERVRPGAFTIHAWLQAYEVDHATAAVALGSGEQREVRLVLPR